MANLLSAKVELATVRRAVILNRVVWPKNRTNVSPVANGRVASMLVKKGDVVRQGDILLKLDARAAQLEVARRQFAVERAINAAKIDATDGKSS